MDEYPLITPLSDHISAGNLPGLPKVSLHIHMPVALEDHTFLFQQSSLPTPPWSRTPLLVHHPMARQFVGSRRIPQSPPHHPRMARPPSQRCDIPIRRHLATRNLAHDVQHVLTKPPRLLHRHLIWIVLHSLYICYKNNKKFAKLIRKTGFSAFRMSLFTSGIRPQN